MPDIHDSRDAATGFASQDGAAIFDSLAGAVPLPETARDGIFLLFHVHCLPSLLPMLQRLIAVGIPARNMVLVPKPYSTIPAALASISQLGLHVTGDNVPLRPGQYDQCIAAALQCGVDSTLALIGAALPIGAVPRLVLVDDGGMLSDMWCRTLARLPRAPRVDVVSVQQTSSGLYPSRLRTSASLNKVNVARSAAKQHFESRVIADALYRKSAALLPQTALEKVGIIGLGTIGRNLAQLFAQAGSDVVVFDRDAARMDGVAGRRAGSIGQCLSAAQTVFGCTGRNAISADTLPPGTPGPHLISCSSRDVEFLALLQRDARHYSDAAPFSVLAHQDADGNAYTLHNWGFPLNFDRTAEWEPAAHIMLTRALIYAAIVQALRMLVSGPSAILPLCPTVQQHIVRRWLDQCGMDCAEFGVPPQAMADESWWRTHSHGPQPH